MRRVATSVIILGMLAFLPQCDSSSNSTGSSSANFDLTGSWNAVLEHLSSTGPCPPTPRQTGEASIVQNGGSFTLTLGRGFTCNPTAACVFEGTVSGSTYSASNSGDANGTTYSSTMTLTASSENAASGSGTSEVNVPACAWQTSLTLTR